MGKKDLVLNRQYTDEFKIEAVRPRSDWEFRIQACGIGSD